MKNEKKKLQSRTIEELFEDINKGKLINLDYDSLLKLILTMETERLSNPDYVGHLAISCGKEGYKVSALGQSRSGEVIAPKGILQI